jgi:hypothetical protein
MEETMKRMTIGVVLVAALATAWLVTPAAQAPADRAAIEKTLMDNEQKVSAAFAKSDVATMKSFIADEAWAVDASGFKGVAQFFKEMPTMQIKVTSEKLSDFKFVWADPNTVVLGYTWMGTGTVMGQPVQSPTYASTVWSKRGTTWKAVFHQETSAAPPMKK